MIVIEVCDRIGESRDEGGVGDISCDARRHSAIQHQARPHNVRRGSEELRARRSGGIRRSHTRKLSGRAPAPVYRMRPGKSVQIGMIETALRLSEKVRNEIEIEVVPTQVFAHQQRKCVVRLARSKHITRCWQFRHVHESDRGLMSRVLREAVLETQSGISPAMRSRVRGEGIVREA